MATKKNGKAKQVVSQKKQYIGISRDHSGSMNALRSSAMKDYNSNIDAIKQAAQEEGIDTIVSVVKQGVGNGLVEREVVNSNVSKLQPLTHYSAEGGTPLFDSIGELISILRAAPDAHDPNVSFLVMAITDGEENQSKHWNGVSLTDEFRRLQATDKWTFTFRVPKGYSRHLVNMGIPAGNIQEWETTNEGMAAATVQTVRAVRSFYAGVSKGVTASSNFYSDLSSVKSKDIKAVMTDISKEVAIWPVKNGGLEIKDFVEKKLKRPMKVGAAFYQLSKPEKAVQDYKMIAIRNKRTGAVYAGKSARDLLNLPDIGTIKLAPGDHGNFDVYIQSTSTNRKLIAGTNVMYWNNATNIRARLGYDKED